MGGEREEREKETLLKIQATLNVVEVLRLDFNVCLVPELTADPGVFFSSFFFFPLRMYPLKT